MSDMAALFALDPLKHTRETIDEVVAYYREARKNFLLGEKSAADAIRQGEILTLAQAVDFTLARIADMAATALRDVSGKAADPRAPGAAPPSPADAPTPAP